MTTRRLLIVLTGLVLIDFVRRSGHIHVFGPTPETLVQDEVAHLPVKLVIANVTLDEVLGGPADRAQRVFPFVCIERELNANPYLL